MGRVGRRTLDAIVDRDGTPDPEHGDLDETLLSPEALWLLEASLDLNPAEMVAAEVRADASRAAVAIWPIRSRRPHGRALRSRRARSRSPGGGADADDPDLAPFGAFAGRSA